MNINPGTKISALLKAHPEALDTIVSIAPKFERLRNPLLRKLMAGRTTIAMAAKIGKCGVETFYEKLKPLGFEVDTSVKVEEESAQEMPLFLQKVKSSDLRTLDVRPTIAAGKDPLKDIMKAVKETPLSGALKVINTFEPTPLIAVLEKQGYQYYVNNLDDETVETWFFKESGVQANLQEGIDVDTSAEGFDELVKKYEGNLIEIDVRGLPMPGPMHKILETLDTIPAGKALYVNHKRIPVFLLPELKEQGYEYRAKEIADGDVKLLIFK